MLMFLEILFSVALAQESISFLSTGSELSISTHAGLKLLNGDIACRLGILNDSYPFGITCSDYSPLFIDSSRRSHLGADLLTEADLQFRQKLVISSVDQWALVIFDAFETTEAVGFSNSTITECAGVRMLGGYCQFSEGTTSKEYKDLQDHSEIRVKLTWHFIDEWRGETGYIEIGDDKTLNLVWSHTYDITSISTPVNLCGDKDVGEGKFAVAVDLRVPHSSPKLTIRLGSTLENNPCEKSWGISGLEVYIK